MSDSVTRAVGVLDKALADLEQVLTGTPGVNPLDVLMDRLEGWKAVHRPQIAAQVGPSALTTFDHAVDAVEVTAAPPHYRRMQQQFGPVHRDLEARLALGYVDAYQRALGAIRADVRKYGEAYLQTGGRISVDFSDTELKQVCQFLGERGGVDIVPGAGVDGRSKITLRLNDVTWYQVLQVVAKTNRLGVEQDGNVIRLSPLTDAAAAKREAEPAAGAAPTTTTDARANTTPFDAGALLADATRWFGAVLERLRRPLPGWLTVLALLALAGWLLKLEYQLATPAPGTLRITTPPSAVGAR
jgi:hypothetical protein